MAHLDQTHTLARIDDEAAAKIATQVDDYDALVHDAEQAASAEKALGILASMRTYPMAVFFSVGISLAIVMEGYDTMLLPNFFAQPAFQKRFGVCTAPDKCQISAAWQAGLTNGAQCGSLIGLQSVGWLTDSLGYRKTMMGSLVLMTAFAFFPFFAQSLPVFLVGQVLQGVPWGIYQTLAVSYAADVCPLSLRHILTTYVNLCWVMGQLVATGVLRATLERTDHWAWRIPYALQWMWPPMIGAVIIFAPESPYFLVRKGRLAEAEQAVRRLSSRHAAPDSAQKTVALLKHTNELEKAITVGASYRDCFRGSNMRRTEVACMAWLVQNMCGSPLMGYSTYFMIQAGLPTKQAFNMSIGQFAIGAVGTISSWWVMKWVGRRTMYISGQVMMSVILLAVGIIASTHGTAWASGALLLTFTGVYDTTVGPACYSIVAEIPSTRLRAKTVVLARMFYNMAGIVINVVNPRMLNPDAWDLGGKSAFVWLVTGLMCLVWTYVRLPEPKNRSYGELDVLFEAGVSARKFKTTDVDQFAMHAAVLQRTRSDEKSSSKGDDEKVLDYSSKA